MSAITYLEGKNVLVFDTETTGLPERVPGAKWGSPNEYWPYNMNEKYSHSRIVSIAWSFIQSFDRIAVPYEKIKSHIRYPEGFDSIPTAGIHGITYEMACSQGIPFTVILEDILDGIMHSEYIIAHNVMFDIHILLNELWRLGTDNAMECINHITNLLDNGRCICTGAIGRDICKIPYKTSRNTGMNSGNTKKTPARYKMPKLIELYQYLFNKSFDGQHSADGDVRALLECLGKM